MRNSALITYLFSINIVVQLIAGCGLATQTNEPVESVTMTAPSTLTITRTAILISTKTSFPINTLTASDRESFVRESLSSNANCNLPCWWGITPGETTWAETEQLLLYLGVRIGSSSGYDPEAIFHGTGGFDFEGISIKNGFSFEEHNGIVDGILIRSDGYNKPEEFQSLWQNYPLKKILKEYGIPDRVLLNVTEVYNLGRGYHLWVFYDELGFMIRYSGGVPDAPVLTICPTLENMMDIDLNLQDPKSILPLERFDAILEDIRLQTETGKTRGLHSIQDATEMNEKEFYDIFMQDDPTCFDTPQDIWTVK